MNLYRIVPTATQFSSKTVSFLIRLKFSWMQVNLGCCLELGTHVEEILAHLQHSLAHTAA